MLIPAGKQNESFQEMSRHATQLQEELVKTTYRDNTKAIDAARKRIDREIEVMEKEKNGLFLSKKNTPEHDRMTKALRLLNAKLDAVTGKKSAQELDPEVRDKVKNSDIKDLCHEAMNATFNYSCLKSKNGKGTILHDDGKARNEASRNTYELLNQLGNRLGFIIHAEEYRNKLAMEVLRFRGNSAWEKTNAEQYAARTICAMSLVYGCSADQRQLQLLSADSIKDSVNDLTQKPEFRQMVKDLGPAGLCDAIVKGDGALTIAYANAAAKLDDPKAKQSKSSLSVQQERDFWNEKTANDEALEEAHNSEVLPAPQS